jgi:DNA-binding NarL/FixJ family response regulator
MRSLRIFLAISDERLRLALLVHLDQEPGMIVAGVADRLTGLISQLEGAQPDALVLDWDLIVEPLEKVFDDLHKLEHQPKIIVLSRDPLIKESILAAGAIFFICKDAPPDTLLSVLNDIRNAKAKERSKKI